MFRTILERTRIYCSSGSRIVKEYQLQCKDLPHILEESGEYNLYDRIQSFKDQCDLRTLVNRYLNTGDNSVLNKVRGIYTDVTAMPKEKTEWLIEFNNANRLFDSLPSDIRSKFDNDPTQFFIKIGTEEFNNIMSRKEVNKVDSIIKEVVEDEQKLEQ